jgi:RNA polymerase sigma-70 factor (ECF subfamily)
MDLYRKYGPAVLRKCERMLGNRSDAEDTMQTLFIDLIDSGREDVDFAYLYRAATNRCLNLLRDAKRRKELLKQEAQAAPLGRNRLHDRVVTVDLLTKLLDRLSDRASEVLVYHYLDDFTQEQIASLLGIARRTVWSDLEQIRTIAADLAGLPKTNSKRGGTR